MSALVDYDPQWPQKFADEVGRLAPVFADHLVSIHHVGSTAVPGLVAKPEIDLLAEVTTDDDLDHWTSRLASIGYRRGGNLSVGHYFFKRDIDGQRTHKLHIFLAGHPEAYNMIFFRDLLRRDPVARDQYGQFKRHAADNSKADIQTYLNLKRPFIAGMLDQR